MREGNSLRMAAWQLCGVMTLGLLPTLGLVAAIASTPPGASRPIPGTSPGLHARPKAQSVLNQGGPRLPIWSVDSVKVIAAHHPPIGAGQDLNGDRFDDLVIGGPLEKGGHGQLWAFYGSTNGLRKVPDWVFEGDHENQHVGTAVAVCDINRDGIADLVATDWQGIYGKDIHSHQAYVFLGSRQGLPSQPSQVLPRELGHYALQVNLCAAGDVNGDGYGDIAIVAWDKELPQDHNTAILVFHGSPGGLVPQPACVIASDPTGYILGHDMACAGDVNGDGFSDLIVGDMKHSGKYVCGGKAYLYLGSAAGLNPKPAWTSEYPLPVDLENGATRDLFFSAGVGGAGDVNRDGFDDVILGASYADHGEREEGAAFLYLGSSQGLASQEPDWVVEGNHGHTHLGQYVAGAGDLDGDGFADVLVGAPYASKWLKDEGVVLVYRGTKKGLAKRASWVFEGERSNGHLGERVGSAGDVNGDGIPDILMAGSTVFTDGDPILRVMVLFGPLGPPNARGHWSPIKPLLTEWQERFDRFPKVALWLGLLGCGGGVVLGLLLVQRKLRRQLAETFEENRRLAAAQERSRIARDIHDHLGADLTHLAAQLDRATIVETSSPVGGPEALPHLRKSAQKAVKTLDELVWATDPRQDSLEGLANYLAEFAPSFLEAHQVACELDLPTSLPSCPLPSRLRHDLFLIAKEALRNAVRHAAATRVRVALTASEQSIVLIVEDNGRGLPQASPVIGSNIDPTGAAGTLAQPRNGRGNGLQNMQHRAQELGGNFSITSVPGGGTRVSVAIDLVPQAL